MPSSPAAVARALVGGLALVLAIAGQFALAITPNWLWLGLASNAVSLGLFVWVSVRPPPTWLGALLARLGITFSALLLGAAVLLSALATVLSVVFAELGRTNYLPVLVLLAVAGLAYLAAPVDWRGASAVPLWRSRLNAHPTEWLLLALITLGAALVRFFNLESVPRMIHGDVGLLGQAALSTNELPLATPFSLFEHFGGLHVLAIGGCLAIPAVYLLGRRLFGAGVGFVGRLVTNVDEPAFALAPEPGAAVIAVGDRADALPAWAREHPGGTFQDALDCRQPMLVAYRLP